MTKQHPTLSSRKWLCLLTAIGLVAGCSDDANSAAADPTAAIDAAVASISATRMKATVDFLADDERGGRISGSVGHQQARQYIVDQLIAHGLEPAGQNGTFLHEYASTPDSGSYARDADGNPVPHAVDTGINLIGLLPGSDQLRADEVIVFMAHYDHLGVTAEGEVYNGAFDNAGGVAAALEVLRVLVEHDAAPSRSIAFLFTDDEERGLNGARQWLADPTIPRESIVLAISADPVGRSLLTDYAPIVIMGPERAPDLFQLCLVTRDFADGDVVFIPRDVIPVFGSDQDVFMSSDPPIPGIWVTNVGMSFYHTVDDTAETIDYRIVLDTTRYLTRTLHLLGNDDGSYPVTGSPPVDADTARYARPMFEGVLASEELTEAERQQTEDLLETLDQAIEAGGFESVTGSPNLYFIQAASFLIFQLSQAHPGPVPPPFPEEQ